MSDWDARSLVARIIDAAKDAESLGRCDLSSPDDPKPRSTVDSSPHWPTAEHGRWCPRIMMHRQCDDVARAVEQVRREQGMRNCERPRSPARIPLDDAAVTSEILEGETRRG